MQIKAARFLPVGINQDLADSRFNPQFLYDAYNIRFTATDSNTSLIIENERGNKRVKTEEETTIVGKIVGYCVCDRDLIIFTTDNSKDYIYKLTSLAGDKFQLTTIWADSGLNLDINHPIDAVYSFETEDVRKVYFVDGKNTAKYFNIENPPKILNDFEFSPNITGEETITVEKLEQGGQFTAGTVQYTFSYYNLNGAETALVDISSLQYPSFKDRAGKPGEVVDSSFAVTISNLDIEHYQYIRLYSIERTSVDTEPKVRYIEAAITEDSITIIDDGVKGYDFDASKLLFVGGESLIVGTIAAKDNVLFAGNISLNNPSLKDLNINPLRVTWDNSRDEIEIESYSSTTEQIYPYKPFASINRFFKYNQLYRFGFQVQYQNGSWSEAKYIGNDSICTQTLKVANKFTRDERIYGFYPTIARFSLNSTIVDELLDSKAIKIRPVMVPVTISDKNIIAQGLVTNTLFNLKERLSGNTLGYSDYLFRPLPLDNLASNSPKRVGNWEEITSGIYTAYLPNNLGYYASMPVVDQYDFIPRMPESEIEDTPIEVKAKRTELSLSSGKEFLLQGQRGAGTEYDPYVLQYDESQTYFDMLWCVDRQLVDFWSPELQYANETELSVLPTALHINNIQATLATRDVLDYQDVTTVGDKISTTLDANATLDYSIPASTSTNYAGRFPGSMMISGWRRLSEYSSVQLAMWNSKQITAGGGDGNKSGNIKITRKAQGRLVYLGRISPIKNPDNSKYKYKIESPVLLQNDNTSSMIAMKPINIGFGSQFYYAGMNKILRDGRDNAIQWNIFIRYKTATHLSFGLRNSNNQSAGLPVIFMPSLDKAYYKNPAKDENVEINKINLESDFNIPGGASSYLGYAIIADLSIDRSTPLGSSQFGGSKTTTITYQGESASLTALVADQSALLNNIWVPCGKAVKLQRNLPVTVECTEGDTFLQRYDCLRVEPINKISEEGEVSADSDNNYQSRTEVVSFLCETQINLDGRWDKNRYDTNVINKTSTNYGQVNLAYSQLNNFFTYKVLDYKIINQNNFKVSFTWSAQKFSNEVVDPWTSLSLATINDASGSYGPIRKLITYNNELFGFQDSGIFNILFNNRVQIPTSDNIPIEISNNYKVQGVRYLSNTKGTLDKLSVGISSNAIYFVDNLKKTISRFRLDTGIQDISTVKGMKSWSFKHITDSTKSSYIDSTNFNIMVDAINSNIYFINSSICLCYNELLDAFTGFYSYENVPILVNVSDDIISFDPNNSMPYLNHRGRYNEFFGRRVKSYITYKVNPEPFAHKIFNNLAFICDCYNISDSIDRITEESILRIVEQDIDSNNRIVEDLVPLDVNNFGEAELVYNPDRCLDRIEVWTEYQSGSADLVYKESPSNLQKKFRVWRINIPRHHGTRQRINNPWMNLRLSLNQKEDENIKMLLHNMEVFYTV